jgi:2-keto-4-pentenoate hydratase/2-oxohepta-3-ene-1,7-dioic acid hydratase in catechol pathway
MIVNVVRYRHGRDGASTWGVVRGGAVTPIPGEFPTTASFVQGVSLRELDRLRGPESDLGSVQVLSPVTRNQQFVCQGANYRQHMLESGVDPKEKTFNMIFTKASSCIVAADSDVVRPARVRFLDYEVELGLVLRRDITAPCQVTDANLHEYVAGAVIVNDYSARDVQLPEMQFYKGKSFRTFGPVGPRLVLFDAEGVSLLRQLELKLTVNGEIRQSDTTAHLVHGPAETLTELSGVHDFAAGDLLSTGTPSGCALAVPSPLKQRLGALVPERTKWRIFLKMQAKRKQYLQPGDMVEASIRSADGRLDLGVQRNRIVAEG